MFCSINSLLLPHKYLFHQKKSSMHTFLIFDLSSLTFLYVSTTVFKLFFFFFILHVFYSIVVKKKHSPWACF